MKRYPGVVTAILLLGSVASAQAPPQEEQWLKFLNAHPQAQKELRANPNLFYDPRWRASHPDIEKYVEMHPGVRPPGGAYGWETRRQREGNEHEHGGHRGDHDHDRD